MKWSENYGPFIRPLKSVVINLRHAENLIYEFMNLQKKKNYLVVVFLQDYIVDDFLIQDKVHVSPIMIIIIEGFGS